MGLAFNPTKFNNSKIYAFNRNMLYLMMGNIHLKYLKYLKV